MKRIYFEIRRIINPTIMVLKQLCNQKTHLEARYMHQNYFNLIFACNTPKLVEIIMFCFNKEFIIELNTIGLTYKIISRRHLMNVLILITNQLRIFFQFIRKHPNQDQKFSILN